MGPDGSPLPGQNKERDVLSQGSFGTGSFTTGTFNARLAGSQGMQILRYIQHEDFGKHGESIKLINYIQVGALDLSFNESSRFKSSLCA